MTNSTSAWLPALAAVLTMAYAPSSAIAQSHRPAASSGDAANAQSDPSAGTSDSDNGSSPGTSALDTDQADETDTAGGSAANGIPWPPKSTTPGRLYKMQIETSLVRPMHHGAERVVYVYLPAAYNNPANAGRRFPVIYLLHGSPGKPHDFIKHDWPSIEEAGCRDLGVSAAILVMPDGNYSGTKFGDSEWANSADGRDRFEDFLVTQVVPWTDQHFRTLPVQPARLIGGVSEGGFGAVNLALRHPDVFGQVIALSGYYNNIGYGWARKAMGTDESFLNANTPLNYLSAGHVNGHSAGDWRNVRFFLGAGADEKRYTTETQQLADRLAALQIPSALLLLDGKHNWILWNQLFDYGLRHMPAATAAQSGDPTLPTDNSPSASM